ncbi:MAG: alanyl-tRNA editing protein [Thaumarchaeota archaeon]|nr:alanyl-tRNA editing protein [Nitrososphaerota archaeon]
MVEMTEMLYLYDHYLKEFDGVIVEILDEKSIVLDRTAIYPRGGGQPSDRGLISYQGNDFGVVESSKDHDRVIHILSRPISDREKSLLIGKQVHGSVDWDLRYKHMRHHTALHILSGIVYQKFGSRITGGQIYADRARLDFTLDDMSKERLNTIELEMNKVVSDNRNVKTFWLGTEEALEKKDLYRLSADLLPKGLEKLRIVDIEGFDAQLDGGTHVARTGEVGTVKISRTENKGKDNKRIEIVLTSGA